MSKAMSRAISESRKIGGKVGYADLISLFSAEANIELANANNETAAVAPKKAFMDALKKTGISTVWKGKEIVPKSVDVHTVADLGVKWRRNLEFKYAIPEGQKAADHILLTEKGPNHDCAREA